MNKEQVMIRCFGSFKFSEETAANPDKVNSCPPYIKLPFAVNFLFSEHFFGTMPV